MLQENFLFDGTVAENIGYANPQASLEEIKAAARVAHCEEFILRFPDGYDTIVGERGIKLSGGQRQRVSIARAILANPRVLILDEATSSLDSESEEMIQDGLRELREGRTTFVIAHRLSTIRSADQILVLEGGEIVERGTHGELIARGGRYRQLHDKQYKIETDRFINPGEDFTPEPPKVVAAAPRRRPGASDTCSSHASLPALDEPVAADHEQHEHGGHEQRHHAQPGVKPTQAVAHRLVSLREAVQLDGELRVELLDLRRCCHALPVAFDVTQHDVFEVADAQRVVGPTGAHAARSGRILAGPQRPDRFEQKEDRDDGVAREQARRPARAPACCSDRGEVDAGGRDHDDDGVEPAQRRARTAPRDC